MLHFHGVADVVYLGVGLAGLRVELHRAILEGARLGLGDIQALDWLGVLAHLEHAPGLDQGRRDRALGHLLEPHALLAEL